MFSIAIVDDERGYRDKLVEFISQFEQEENCCCKVFCFKNGMEFLGDFEGDYDVIFMDIEMPMMNGIEIAKHLREIDKDVALIFITKMAQFAVNGYEVNALDFIVKPVSYFNFSVKLKKALSQKNKNVSATLALQHGDMVCKLKIADILYLEVRNHDLIYHTSDGEISIKGSLNEREKALAKYNFVRCNHPYVINLSKVVSIRGNVVHMENGDELQISRSRRKELLTAFSEFLGGA